MRKITKALMIALCIISIFFCVQAYAKEETTEFSLISANVSGLPAFLSKYDRDVPASQETLGGMLNRSGYDIICVQEDFQYHDKLAAAMTDYPYRTYSSGGVPIGDGLNIFSKYPIYNIERVPWNEYHGVFSDGSDALTPKGFIKCTVDVDGVLIDLYNVHFDAYRTEGDQLAKKAQLVQLAKYIDNNSKDRAVIITGDTNLTFHNDPLSEMYRILITEGEFVDAWVEMKNDGNYLQGEENKALVQSWYDRFGGHDWGRWDSVERVLYRNGGGISFSPTRFEYVIYTDRSDDIKALTDHRMMECVIEIDKTSYQRPDIALQDPVAPSVLYSFFHGAAMLFRFLFILILEILTLNIALTLAVAVLIIALAVFIKRRKTIKKNNT